MENTEKKTKVKSKDYPAVTLNQTIAFVEKFKDYPLNKPISYDIAAQVVGVSSTTKSFTYTVSAARQYGLISTSTGKALTLTDVAKRLVRPTDDANTLRKLKLSCFSTPKLYGDLINEYSGKSLPTPITLENVLVTNFGIAPKVAKGAASTFIDSANEVGAIQSGILDLNIEASNEEVIENQEPQSASSTPCSSVSEMPLTAGEFSAPLTIPFGDMRKAVLYMPLDATKEDAEYVQDMVTLMFKRVYGVE